MSSTTLQTEAGRRTPRRGSAMTAINMGHEAWTLGVGDFVYKPDGSIHANARSVNGKEYDSLETYMDEMQGDEARREQHRRRRPRRADAAQRSVGRHGRTRPGRKPPASSSANSPCRRGTHRAERPRATSPTPSTKPTSSTSPNRSARSTCISRNPEEIKEFIAGEKGKAVIKPLQGSGGTSVFLVTQGRRAEPQPDDRRGDPRRLLHRPGIPARGEGRRRAAVRDERPAAAAQTASTPPSAA